MGKELSDRQAELLVSESDRFIIFLDGDEPARVASKRVTGKLIHKSFVRVVRYPDGPKRKPAHFDKDELKKLISIGNPSL